MSNRRFTFALAAAAVLPLIATAASAQSLGIGPRFSFVRGHLPSGTPSSSLIGGTVRMVGSRHHAFELALDRRTVYNEDRTGRTRETPLQASILIYPARAAFAPYLVGGFGVYREQTETLSPSGVVLTSERAQRTGWHAGAGLELLVTRRIGLYGDYRFRFVRLGVPEGDEEPINIPGLDSVKLAHRGSMWTGGIAIYF
jgi:hypothetical protein